ncbi:MAG: PQQ-binding-like beta-propeller repeat protein [Deltaproteobacteria bacterium]|nr:PQQ-binding-like beta-propeller repeat protein [Deltaproteobacteria bacterium]
MSLFSVLTKFTRPRFSRSFLVKAIIPLLVVFVVPSSLAFAAPCATPPSGTGVTVLPNVLVILDNSGSMKEDAYKEPYDRNKSYKGFFDPTKRYNYSSSGKYFYESESGSGDWSGNFLNWCCMTRVDMAKYVLIGGARRTEGSNTYLFLNVETYGGSYDNYYNDNTTPYQTPFHGQGNHLYQTVDAASGGTCGLLKVYRGWSCKGTYNVRVKIPDGFEPTGLLHDLEGDVRLGLMYFNIDPTDTNIVDGGHITKYVKKLDSTQLNELVADLSRNYVHPSSWNTYNCTDATCEKSSWTPLTESLYEGIRYFQQESPYYYSSDYTVADGSHPERDPLYNEDYQNKIWCAKNYIVLLTDGETTQDLKIPSWLRDYDGDGCDPKPGAGCGYDYDWTDPCVYPFNCGDTSCGDKSCNWPDPTSCYSKKHGSCGSAYLDDVAYYAHTQDLRSDLPNDQTIAFYSVYMFGSVGVGDTLLHKAAEKGGGDYYLAEDADEIATALENIFEDIVHSAASASSVAVTSETTSSARRIFIPYYKHPEQYLWWGNIRAFNLDADGNILNANGDPAQDTDDDGIYDNPVWDGAVKVAEKAVSDSRNISTFISGSKVPFDTDHATTIGKYFDVDFNNNGTYDESTEVSALISYIRGNDNPPGGFNLRSRYWEDDGRYYYLGDIIHARPIFTGKPSARFDLIYGDSTYWDFYWANTTRDEVVFTGANDGMLHAFDASTGEELWAYIPYNLLPHLKWLADTNYCHCFYVDLSSRIWEMKLGTDWKFILLGGMRLGGTPVHVDTDDDGTADTWLRSAYFALDITNPSSPPAVKWEINDERFGYTTSKPIAVKVENNWYVVFGSGPKTRDGEGNSTADGYSDTNGYIFVVNPSNGNIVRTISLGTRGANNFFGSPVAVDYDLDYSVDVIYIGDAKGNLWRIKTFTGSGESKSYSQPSSWIIDVAGLDPGATNPEPLLALSPTNADQPILMKPMVSLDDGGRLWIYVGTGRYLCYNDNVCCDEGVVCPPGVVGGSCPSGNGCSITETINGSGEDRSKFMAVGVYDRYWDDTQGYILANSTITLSNLDHRVIISGQVTGNESLTGYAIVHENYPSQDIATTVEGKGWYFHLVEDRERCLGDFLVYREVVFFLTYKPSNDPNDPCTTGGTSRVYGVYYTSGTSTITPLFDLTGEGTIDQGDTVITANRAVGAAILEMPSGKSFAGGSPIALGNILYLPLGVTVIINPPGSPYETGITSWKEVMD